MDAEYHKGKVYFVQNELDCRILTWFFRTQYNIGITFERKQLPIYVGYDRSNKFNIFDEESVYTKRLTVLPMPKLNVIDIYIGSTIGRSQNAEIINYLISISGKIDQGMEHFIASTNDVYYIPDSDRLVTYGHISSVKNRLGLSLEEAKTYFGKGDIFKEGDEVLVANHNCEPVRAIYLHTFEGAKYPYIVVPEKEFGNYRKGSNYDTAKYNLIKHAPTPFILELTFQDISDGKGVGHDPNCIRIKQD